MYRDDTEALRGQIAGVRRALASEQRARRAAEAAASAALREAQQLRAAPRRAGRRYLVVLPGLLLATLVAGALLVHRADRARHQQEIAKLRSRASAAWQQALKQEQRLNRLRRRVVIPARRPGPAPAPAHDAGFLRANTFPWARILVDGRDTGHRTPLAPGQRLALSPGPHRVTFEVQGQRFSFPVKIVTGTTTRLVHRLPVEPIRY